MGLNGRPPPPPPWEVRDAGPTRVAPSPPQVVPDPPPQVVDPAPPPPPPEPPPSAPPRLFDVDTQTLADVAFVLDCLNATGGVASVQAVAGHLSRPLPIQEVERALERLVTERLAERVGPLPPQGTFGYRRSR